MLLPERSFTMAGDSVSFEKFVERAYRGIPERRSTIEEKEMFNISINLIW